MFWSKPKILKIGTCITKVPRQVHVNQHHVMEMVCGDCSLVTHDIYEFELPVPGADAKMPGKWKRAKCHSGDFATIAKCTTCGQVRPLDARANKWLYEIKAISQSEYLSWAD